MELKNKNAIITGGRRGIGKAVLELFAKNGVNIWVCSKTCEQRDINFCNALSEEYGVWIKPVVFDLSDSEAVIFGIKEIIKEKLPIDILVNNAAVSYGSSINMMKIETVRSLFEINYFSQLQIIQLISRVMMKQKQGAIINVGSISGMEVYQGNLAYGSSKAAFMFATKVISKELAPYGIRVNAVAPGTVHTDMDKARTTEQMKEVINRTALKRAASPEEIAKVILFLASSDSSYITGEIIKVDGGRSDF